MINIFTNEFYKQDDSINSKKVKTRNNRKHRKNGKTRFEQKLENAKKHEKGTETPVQHRSAGGEIGMLKEMLKDPNENERMEIVKR